MTDALLSNLQKMFENYEKRFNAPIKESYDNNGDEESDNYVDSDNEVSPGEDVPDDEAKLKAVTHSDDTNSTKLPPEAHPNVFPQPAASQGIIFLNPKAIPNDYGPAQNRKGHVVCILKQDISTDPSVRTDGLKNGKVYVPFSIIHKDDSGREYVTKDDLNTTFKKGNFVFKLLKFQPLAHDRHLAKSDKNRKQWAEPTSPSETSKITAAPGTLEYYTAINKQRVTNGLQPIPPHMMKIKK